MFFFVYFVIFMVLIFTFIRNRAKFIPAVSGSVRQTIVKICYIISNGLTEYPKSNLFNEWAKSTV
jgi:hypothetical protein